MDMVLFVDGSADVCNAELTNDRSADRNRQRYFRCSGARCVRFGTQFDDESNAECFFGRCRDI